MTTTPATRHRAPWTFARALEMITPRPARNNTLSELMTGKEAAARALYHESVQGSRLDMLEYDNNAMLRGGWEAAAERRIIGATADEYVAELSGYTMEQWADLPEIARKDAREQVAWEARQAS